MPVANFQLQNGRKSVTNIKIYNIMGKICCNAVVKFYRLQNRCNVVAKFKLMQNCYNAVKLLQLQSQSQICDCKRQFFYNCFSQKLLYTQFLAGYVMFLPYICVHVTSCSSYYLSKDQASSCTNHLLPLVAVVAAVVLQEIGV